MQKKETNTTKARTNRVSFSLQVSKQTHKAWRLYSAMTDNTIADVIKTAMKEYMANHPAQ